MLAFSWKLRGIGEEVGLHPVRIPRRRAYSSREILTALGFVLPSLVGFLIFLAWPLFKGLLISFTDWDLLTKRRFVGPENYINLFADGEFWNSLWVTLQYVLWNIPIQTVLAMGIALVMKRIKSSSLLRGALIVPWFLPNVVVALLALVILDPAIGIANEALKAMGLHPLSFLTTTQLAMPSIAGINTWKFMGYTALIIFAGLQGIPTEVEEAALIDGATGWTAFRKITLPLLRPVLAFVIVTSVIGSFQVYDTVAIATRGGPVNATWVMNFFIFKNAFEGYRMGYATAASMVLFVLLVGVGFLQIRLMRANESD
jgi:multiple sugar transport system permease protein